MRRELYVGVGLLALIAVLGASQAILDRIGMAQAQEGRSAVPVFEVDPSWPKPLPNNWTFGEFSGVHVDARDHIWVNQRPRSLGDDEKYRLAGRKP
jgi:hypothetical protein